MLWRILKKSGGSSWNKIREIYTNLQIVSMKWRREIFYEIFFLSFCTSLFFFQIDQVYFEHIADIFSILHGVYEFDFMKMWSALRMDVCQCSAHFIQKEKKKLIYHKQNNLAIFSVLFSLRSHRQSHYIQSVLDLFYMWTWP